MRHLTLGMLAVVAALGMGCDKVEKAMDGEAEHPASEKKEKFEIDWVKDNTFTVKGDAKQKGECAIFEGNYQVTLHGYPEKTRWKAGDKKGLVESNIYDIIKIKEVAPLFGKVPIAKISDYKLSPDEKLELVRPDGSWVEFDLPKIGLGLSVEKVLEAVENGPVLFEGESEEDPKPGLSVLYGRGLRPKVFGQATTLADVDGIAVSRTLPAVKGTKKCTGYKDNKDKPMPDIDLQLKETEVVIYDRRKGGQIDKKVFPPHEECPMFTFTKKGETKKDSSTPTKAIEDWLREKTTK